MGAAEFLDVGPSEVEVLEFEASDELVDGQETVLGIGEDIVDGGWGIVVHTIPYYSM